MSLAKHILVPTDFSESSELALGKARELADHTGARVTIVHVLAVDPLGLGELEQPTEQTRELEAAVHVHLDRLRDEHFEGRDGVKTVLLRARHVAMALCELAEQQGVDMIVMATQGRTGLPRLLIGSVAESVVRHATCPVLLLRSRVKDSLRPWRRSTVPPPME